MWRELELRQGGGEAAATRAGREKDEEWVQQAGWGGAARGRGQALGGGQGGAPEEARVEQARVPGGTRALKEKAAAEPYEKGQMLWEGMAGRGWAGLVQQWGVPMHGGASPAAKVDCSLDGGGRPSAGALALGGVNWAGGKQGTARGGNGHAAWRLLEQPRG